MSVSRYVPKFKHYGTSMSLDTRVRCVIGSHNMGYSNYYKTLLTKLGCLEENDEENRHLSSGITRIGKIKACNKAYKQQLHVKRRRKHGLLARTHQQLLQERVDRARNLGTYQTGVAILGDETIQQSSISNKKQTKKADKICSSCGKAGRKTWRTKTCANHHQYLQSKQKSTIGTDNQQNIRTHLQETENQANKVSEKIGVHGDDNGRLEMVVDDFGVAASKNEATPTVGNNDVLPLSKNDLPASADNFHKNNEENCETRKVSNCTNNYGNSMLSSEKSTSNDKNIRTATPVLNHTNDVSSSTKDLLNCTVIHDCVDVSAGEKYSTDVDSTDSKQIFFSDSTQDVNVNVSSIVENLNDIEDFPSNFEFFSDEDSENSFFTPDK